MSTAYWGQEVRVPLKGFTGSIAKLDFTPVTTKGEIWLVDSWTWRPGTPALGSPAAPPRVDIGIVSVDEGNSGTRTVKVPVKVTGKGNGSIRIFTRDKDGLGFTSRVHKVRAGKKSLTIDVPVTGNNRYGEAVITDFSAKAVQNTMMGGFIGGLELKNDDPLPKVTFEPVTSKVKEGKVLTWKARLSTEADLEFLIRARLEKPSTGTELPTSDVDPDWFADSVEDEESPKPFRPLSETSVTLFTLIEDGQLTSEGLEVPTVADAVAEPERSLQLRTSASVLLYEGEQLLDKVGVATLKGIVTD
jgi:hypothetical protein